MRKADVMRRANVVPDIIIIYAMLHYLIFCRYTKKLSESSIIPVFVLLCF